MHIGAEDICGGICVDLNVSVNTYCGIFAQLLAVCWLFSSEGVNLKKWLRKTSFLSRVKKQGTILAGKAVGAFCIWLGHA